MDHVSERIINSLMISDNGFMELYRSVKEHTSKQTFSTRLQELQNLQIVTKKGKKYTLLSDKKRKKAFNELSKLDGQLNKIIEKLRYRDDAVHQAYHHIIEALYFHNYFTFIQLSGTRLPHYYDRRRMQNQINTMEDTIIRILNIIKQKDPKGWHHLIHVIEKKLDQDHFENNPH